MKVGESIGPLDITLDPTNQHDLKAKSQKIC